MVRRRVDLPDPEGPTITATPPGSIVSVMSLRTSTAPKDLRTFVISTRPRVGAGVVGSPVVPAAADGAAGSAVPAAAVAVLIGCPFPGQCPGWRVRGWRRTCGLFGAESAAACGPHPW